MPDASAQHGGLVAKYERAVVLAVLVFAAGATVVTGSRYLLALFTVLAVLMLLIPVGGGDRAQDDAVLLELRAIRDLLQRAEDSRDQWRPDPNTSSVAAPINRQGKGSRPVAARLTFAIAVCITAGIIVTRRRRSNVASP
jgi:hypothetical protein